MPAHTRPLDVTCHEEGCTKRATVEVWTGRNERFGRYCEPHGEAKARQLREEGR